MQRVPSDNHTVVESPIGIPDGWSCLIDDVISIDLKFVFVCLAVFQDDLNGTLVAVFERVMFLKHKPFGLPVVPTAYYLNLVADELGGELDDLLITDLVVVDIVAILVKCLWIYLS